MGWARQLPLDALDVELLIRRTGLLVPVKGVLLPLFRCEAEEATRGGLLELNRKVLLDDLHLRSVEDADDLLTVALVMHEDKAVRKERNGVVGATRGAGRALEGALQAGDERLVRHRQQARAPTTKVLLDACDSEAVVELALREVVEKGRSELAILLGAPALLARLLLVPLPAGEVLLVRNRCHGVKGCVAVS